jgi:PmbA protein
MDINQIIDLVKKELKDYQWEIYYLKTKKLKAESKNFELDVFTSSDEAGYSLRVLKGKSQGFAYSSSFDEKSLYETISKAKELAEITSSDEANGFLEELEDTEKIEYFDTSATKISPIEKAEKSIYLERLVKEKDERIKRVRSSSFSETIFEKGIFNSFGIEILEKGTIYSAMVSAVAEENGDSQIAWSYTASRFLEDLELESIADEATFTALSLLNSTTIKTKVMPVVFSPYVSAQFLSTFSSAFTGDALIKDKTLFKGKENKSVASELITIIDNGRLKKGLATTTYDDEGVPTKENFLIKDGIFQGFLQNLYTAKKLNTNSTGNGSRSGFRTLPHVDTTNLYIENGKTPLDEILKSYDEVFYITDVMGLHTADPISGEFSVGASGIIYSKGEILRGIRGVTIADNFLGMLNKVNAVADNLKFYGSVGSPSILVENVMVAGE